MKRRHLIAMLFALSVYHWGSNPVFSQTARRQADAATPVEQGGCSVQGINFTCPEGFKPLEAGTTNNYILLYDRKEKLGLFFAVWPPPLYNGIVTELLDSAAAKMFPK